jgi:hypothetical protein
MGHLLTPVHIFLYFWNFQQLMNYKSSGYIIILLLFIHSLNSCTPGTCEDVTISTVKAGFYETGTGNQLTADSVTMYGLGNDTTRIYNNALNLKSISFPLDPGSDTSVLILRINGHNDTVTLVYTSYAHLVSKECGFTFYHLLDTVYNTRPDLDFLKKNQNITTVNEENIRIYY